METKSLLYGIVGFIVGGLIVSVAATTFDKPECAQTSPSASAVSLSVKHLSAGLQSVLGEVNDTRTAAGS